MSHTSHIAQATAKKITLAVAIGMGAPAATDHIIHVEAAIAEKTAPAVPAGMAFLRWGG
jgi:hypothetical protein